MARMSVVLPAPFGPSKPSNSPSPSESDIPSSARVAPNDLRASLISSTAMQRLPDRPAQAGGKAGPAGQRRVKSARDYPMTTTYGESPSVGPHFSRDERSPAADDRRRDACRGIGPTLTFAGDQTRHPRAYIKTIAPHGGGPMRLKHAAVAALMAATLLLPARAARAEAHAWALSGLAGYGQFSDKLKYPADSLADAVIYGGRFARGIGEYWILEVGGAFGQTHEMLRNGSDGNKVSLMNLSASLIAQMPPAGNFGRFYVAAGGGYTRYDSDGAPDDLHFG